MVPRSDALQSRPASVVPVALAPEPHGREQLLAGHEQLLAHARGLHCVPTAVLCCHAAAAPSAAYRPHGCASGSCSSKC
eukprot:6926116-Prymnesium_polylepis.1